MSSDDPKAILRNVTVACPHCGHEQDNTLDVAQEKPYAICQCKNKFCAKLYSLTVGYDVAKWPKKKVKPFGMRLT